MAQVIPYLGTRNIESIGQGLGQGIQELASRKLSQMNEQDKRSRLRNALLKSGRSAEEADLLLELPEKDLLSGLQTIEPTSQVKPETRSSPQEVTQFNIAAVKPEHIYEYAKSQGRDLSPQDEEKIAARLKEIQSDPNISAGLQEQIMSQFQGQQRPSLAQTIGPNAQPQLQNVPQQATPIQPQRITFAKPKSGMEKIAEKTLELKQQNAIEKSNAPFKAAIEEKANELKPVKKVTTEIKELLNQPDIQWGSIKSLIPNRFQNEPTQALVSKLAELVLLKAQLGKGVPSKMRLELEEMAKPQIWQKPKTIKYLVDSIDAAADEGILPEQSMDEIIAEHGREPENLKTLVKDRTLIKSLPSAAEYSPNTIIKVDNKRFGIKNGQWSPL